MDFAEGGEGNSSLAAAPEGEGNALVWRVEASSWGCWAWGHGGTVYVWG